MKHLICIIILALTLSASASAQDLVSQIFPFAQPDGNNGTYFIVSEEGQFIIGHAGTGDQQTLLLLSGTTGSMFLGGRVVNLSANENIFINNYQLVIGEPDSGGKGLRSLSVTNEAQRVTFNGVPY